MIFFTLSLTELPFSANYVREKKRVNVYNLRELSGRSHQFSLNLMTLPAFLTIDASCLASAALAVDTATAVQTAFTVDTAGTASAFMTAV